MSSPFSPFCGTASVNAHILLSFLPLFASISCPFPTPTTLPFHYNPSWSLDWCLYWTLWIFRALMSCINLCWDARSSHSLHWCKILWTNLSRSSWEGRDRRDEGRVLILVFFFFSSPCSFFFDLQIMWCQCAGITLGSHSSTSETGESGDVVDVFIIFFFYALGAVWNSLRTIPE